MDNKLSELRHIDAMIRRCLRDLCQLYIDFKYQVDILSLELDIPADEVVEPIRLEPGIFGWGDGDE